MARDFLAVAASGVGVERLFNSARDICSYRRSRLDGGTIQKLMLQMTTDRFLVKSEYRRMQEDNDEQDFVDEMFEHDSEDSTVCNYISDKGEDDNDAEDDNNAEDVEDDGGVEDDETTPKANHLRPRRVQHEPGQYRAMMDGT